MNDDKIIEILKKNNDLQFETEVSASISVLLNILVKQGLVTEKDFTTAKDKCVEFMYKEFAKRMTPEQKKTAEILDAFNIGGINNE